MPVRIRSRQRRTPTQAAADRRADELARYLGRGLRDARRSVGATQADVARAAAISRSLVSKIERGLAADASLMTWARTAQAIGVDVRAYVAGATATDGPRDAVHLRAQELIARSATAGGWQAHPERAIDLDPGRSRAADLVLTRGIKVVLVEVYDWLPDVGDAFRSWDRKLASVERRAIALAPAVDGATEVCTCGIWILRATRTNRRLVAAHRTVFRARFPGSAAAWLAALERADRPMPKEPALVWITVAGDRLVPARLG
jgi:transcriptional regulator with XRE-family HTH domain